ncbi:MAG: hypothetical protein E7402_05920 [Ruminococcaceae bacterium]|nr:hypothetical protein [Oscillospiraceae bacterium]
MIVGIEENLEDYKNAIERAGHRAVPLYGYQGAMDAAVYRMTTMGSLVQSAPDNSGDGGVFMLNVSNMEPWEVVRALEHKSYSSIF